MKLIDQSETGWRALFAPPCAWWEVNPKDSRESAVDLYVSSRVFLQRYGKDTAAIDGMTSSFICLVAHVEPKLYYYYLALSR